MNTITSFSRNNQYQMKNNQVHSNVQFQGLNVRMLTPKGRKIQKGIIEHHHDIASHLGQNVETIVEITKGASLKKLSLLDRLSSRAIAVTYKHPEKTKEVGDHAVNIFKNIKKPSKTQAYIISHGHGSFETMDRVFEAAHNNPKRFKLAKRVNREVLDTRNPKHSEMTAELLESKNSDKYVEDFDSYKSYLILNREDKNVVKNLDKMVESGQYNARKYDIELENNRIFTPGGLQETPVLNRKVLSDNYTKEGHTFLNYFISNFGVKEGSLQAGNDKDLLDIYKSTTKENVGTRMAIIDRFQYHKFFNINADQSKRENKEVSALKELFQKVESDKHAKNFFNKTVKHNIDIDTVQEYVDILNSTEPKKLDVFFSNAVNIMNQTSGKTRLKTLSKEIENPFFKTRDRIEHDNYEIQEGYRKKPSILKKAKKYIKNQINKAKYNITGGSNKVAKQEVKAIDPATIEMPKLQPIVKEPVAAKPAMEVKEAVTSPAAEIKEIAPAKPVAEVKEVAPAAEIKEIAPAAEVKEAAPVKTVKISRVAPKAPNAKKLAVINDVNGIIEKKLGPKVLEDQKREYAIKATKMRMNMLPEIFASIKETRAADRKAGRKLNVSNKDAYGLYSIINGRNKKLVNYMLKKRNADGTRMFDIKEIITTVSAAEKKVRMDKYAAPKTYRAADAKAYYAELLDSKIQQYGKLERSKKTK